MTTTVHGTVQVPDGGHPTHEVDVIVRIEEVSRADAAAEVVATHHFTTVLPRSGGTSLPFAFPIDEVALDPRGTYTIRCHIDTSGTGSVERGDYLSTAFQTVAVPLGSDPLVVHVQRI
jgi:putative lipoprotein